MPCLSTEAYTFGYTYCDFCRRQWHDKCPVHQLKQIPDSPVPISGYKADPNYAKNTMPKMFSIAPSRIPDAGLGVYAKEEIPMGCVFGPYIGQFVETPRDDNYTWAIRDENGKEYAYVDGSDPSNSNWLRYINCARNTLERNLIAYQFKGDIYYRTCKSVPQYSELLVFYGYEFAKKLGISRHSFDVPDNSMIINTVFTCFKCETIFNNPLSLDDHQSECSQVANEENDHISKLQSDKSTDSLISGKTHCTELGGMDCESALSEVKLEQETEKEIIKHETHEYVEDDTNTNGKNIPADKCKINADDSVIGGTAISKDVPEVSVLKLNSTHGNNLENFKQGVTYECQENQGAAIDSNQLYKSRIDLELQMKDDNLSISGDGDFRCDPKRNLKDSTKQNGLNKNNLKCAHCEYIANHKHRLRKHIEVIHLNFKDFKCPYCVYNCSSKGNLSQHVKAVHLNIKDFKCPQCRFSSSDSKRLQNHIKVIHLNIKDFKCPQCTISFSSKSHLTRHIKAIHFNIKDFKCTYCTYSCGSKSHLTNHLKAIHLNIKDFKCPQCTFSCSSKSHLTRHIKAVHWNVKDVKCTECAFSCSSKSHLTRHVKAIHLNIKDFKCHQCTFISSSKSYLTQHIKVMHLNVKDFKCHLCSYSCSSKGHLTNHMKAIHLNVNNFKCPYCEFSTSYKGNLKLHIKVIHLNIKDFKCPHCEYSSSQKDNLKTHIKSIHLNIKDFKCSQCTFTSSCKSHLTRHMKAIHLNVKNFKCPHCTFISSYKGSLKDHLKAIHLNVKDFKCVHCTYSSNKKGRLKCHIEKIHLNVKDVNVLTANTV